MSAVIIRKLHKMSRFAGSIRKKIHLILLLLLLLLAILAGTGIYAVRMYRDSVIFVSQRSQELPLAIGLAGQISQMRLQIASLKNVLRERDTFVSNKSFGIVARTEPNDVLTFGRDILGQSMKESFVRDLKNLRDLERNFCGVLREGQAEVPESRREEGEILHEITLGVENLERLGDDPGMLDDRGTLDVLGQDLDKMSFEANLLIGNLQTQLQARVDTIHAQYRWFLGLVGTVALTSAGMLLVFLRLMYAWIFRPLRELVAGSQMIAQGRFNFRIKLDAKDEMSQLAEAFNRMTERFEAIRDELDGQVQAKSRELVRTERLASVGFLAAGVAHEINNPLASIAMSAESLQRRILPILETSQNRARPNEPSAKGCDRDIIERYLAMIQEEAFRCKGITEKLLDFARTERKIREQTNLAELVGGIVEMLGPMGKYRGKHIRLDVPASLYALVNPQEMKQVTLNLLTNALDSVDDGGTVKVRVFDKDEYAHLVFEDDGCGMDSAILQNVFEPFFTKRKNGQGTGLGLSITHRIVSEHQGRIEAYSAGPGRGSVFQVEIPITSPEAERLAAMKSKEVVVAQRRAA